MRIVHVDGDKKTLLLQASFQTVLSHDDWVLCLEANGLDVDGAPATYRLVLTNGELAELLMAARLPASGEG